MAILVVTHEIEKALGLAKYFAIMDQAESCSPARPLIPSEGIESYGFAIFSLQPQTRTLRDLAAARQALQRGPAASLDPTCRLICLALLSSHPFRRLAICRLMALGAIILLILEGLSIAKISPESAFILSCAYKRLAAPAGGDMIISTDGLSSRRPLYLKNSCRHPNGKTPLCLNISLRAARRPNRNSASNPVLRRFDIGLGSRLSRIYSAYFQRMARLSRSGASRACPSDQSYFNKHRSCRHSCAD